MGQLDEVTFDHLVSGLYRAATGEVDWQELLRDIQAAFGAWVAVLQTIDLAHNGRLVSLRAGGDDPHIVEAGLLFVREWHLHDPRRQRFLAMGPRAVGHWMHCDDAFDEAFVRQNPFFQQYLLGYGTRFNSAIALPLSQSLVMGFTMELPPGRGPLTSEERHYAARLGVHVQDAMRAHERVRSIAAQAVAGHQLLDAFPYPMWLIDADRFVMYANSGANEMMTLEHNVALHHHRLTLCNSRHDRRLTECLTDMASAVHGCRQLVDARRQPSDPPTWLHLMAVRPMEVMGAFGERPFILVTLLSPDLVRPLDPHALGEIFGFTPMQARVAGALADGLTAIEIAGRVGCAESTARTHLRVVMEKLGARRLQDAIRLLRQGDALWASAAASRR